MNNPNPTSIFAFSILSVVAIVAIFALKYLTAAHRAKHDETQRVATNNMIDALRRELSNLQTRQHDGKAFEGSRMNSVNNLRWFAAAEALTLLVLLLVAVPLKHFAGFGYATRVMGPVHGLAFLAFCWAVMRTSAEGWLSKRDVARLLVGAVIPLGGLVNERWLKSRAMTVSNDAL